MRSRALALLIAAGALVTSGCVHSRVDEEWGQAEPEAMALQVANPTRPIPAEAPQGLDAKAAEKAADDYYKGPKQDVPLGPSMIFQEAQ
jgi:hypothetical protein